MRPVYLATLTLAIGLLTACSAPPVADIDPPSTERDVVPETPAEYGPGDYCASTVVYVQTTTRLNFSLGSDYYRNGDTCAAYPFIKHLLATEPLFTGEDPDDRNYLRMASIYEDFAANVDSTNRAETKAYLDSARAMRRAGIEAMEREGIAYDPYLRHLNDGFFCFQYSAYYEDAEDCQYAAFNRALDAQPDSLGDWYLTRLFEGSATAFGGEPPNPERAAYVRRLASVADDPALKQNYEQFASYLETEPFAAIPDDVPDAFLIELIAEVRAGNATLQRAQMLLWIIQEEPDRIHDLGEDPDELRTVILRLDAITAGVDNPRTLFALAFQAYRDGDRARGDGFFERAIANAESNPQRADFHYSRGVSPYGAPRDFERALEYFASHGPSLYRQAVQIGDAVGQPTSLEGRFAYWCLADRYRSIAAQSSGTVATNSRRAAAGYERAAPSREEWFLAGYRAGQSVTASLGAFGTCTTRVR